MAEAGPAARSPAAPGPLPLALRNPLAELILDAFDHPEAWETLQALARLEDQAPAGGPGDLERLGRLPWFEAAPGGTRLRAAHRPYWGAVRARSAAALVAVGPGPASPGCRDLALLDRARALADQGLYFEVHELLEPWWLRARGPERLAVQGLIQVAVGLQHLTHGNLAGARALLRSGLDKVQGTRGTLPLASAPWEEALGTLLAGLAAGGPRPPLPAWPGPAAGDTRPAGAAGGATGKP